MNVKNAIKVLIFTLIFSMVVSSSLVTYAAGIVTIDNINKMTESRKNGNNDECIKIADSLLLSDSTLMIAYENKVNAYFNMSKWGEALEVLQKLLKLNLKNRWALYNAACACSLMGKSDQAVEYLKQLLNQDISLKKDIIKDSDFESIRQNEGYKKLFGISIIVGGELLDLDTPPINKEGRIMLPMRTVFETLGAQITWDGNTKTVTAVKDKTVISITINEKIAVVNGTKVEIDVPAMIQDDRTFVPVRFASEALKAKVNWDPEGQVVEILTSVPEGNVINYDDIKKEIDGLTTVSVVDGAWPEPYGLSVREGMTLIIAKNKKALDFFNSLDSISKAKYMYQTTYSNFALVIGCVPVHMKFIYDGKVYYTGDMYYDKKGEGIELTYYEKGLPMNIVKQYKSKFNYKDYYFLPESEKTTSKIED